MSNVHTSSLTGPLARYGGALAAVAASFLIRRILTGLVGDELPTYVTFYPAVVAVGLAAGFGPSLLATATSGLVAVCWVLPAQSPSAIPSSSSAAGLVFFLCMGALISVMAQRHRRVAKRFAACQRELALKEDSQPPHEQSEWLRAMVSSISDAVVATDSSGRIRFMNPAAALLTGWKQEEAIGQSVQSVVRIDTPEACQAALGIVEQTMCEECAVSAAVESSLLARDGSAIPIEGNAAPIRGSDGRINGAVLVLRDVNTLRRAQAEVAKERARLQTLVDVADVGLLVLRDDMVVQQVNETVYRWVGHPAASSDGPRLCEVVRCVHAAGDPAGCGHGACCASCNIRRAFHSALRKGQRLHDLEVELTREVGGDQVRLWFEISADPAVVQGQPHVILSMNNITARKQAAEEMRRLNAELEDRVAQQVSEIRKAYTLLHGIMAGTSDKIAVVDADFRITAFNDAFRQEAKRVYGVDVAIGQNGMDLLVPHAEDTKSIFELFHRAIQGESICVEHELGDPNRERNTYELSCFPLRDGEGRIAGAAFVARDVTARRRAETALQRERQRLTDVLELLPAYVVLLTPDHRVSFANHFFRERFGEVDGNRCFQRLLSGAQSCESCDTGGVLKSGKPVCRERTGPDGRHYEVWDFPFVDAGGSPLVLEMGIDITEGKRAEEQLRSLNQALARRADQLQMLAGELTNTEQRERRRLADILHDHLQQLLYAARLSLGPIIGRAENEDLRARLQQVDELIRDSINSSRSLTAELSPPISGDAHLKSSLEWLCQHVQEAYGLAVELDADPETETPSEEVRLILFQAVRELLFNVVKHAGVREARVELTSPLSEQIRIVVSDEGAGFDTAKLQSERAGDVRFGLFSMRERLRMIGGSLKIASDCGQGTRATVSVPRPAKRRSVHEPCGAEPAEPCRGEASWKAGTPRERPQKIRIVLVDDHKVLREGLARLLQEQPNFEVVGEASDGRTAVALALSTRPDVVIMDVTLPELNGVEATRRIVAALPEVRVIGLSMHEEEDMVWAMLDAGAAVYLPKGGSARPLIAAIEGTRCEDKVL